MNKLFRELILISIGKRDEFSRIPTDEDWDILYALAQKQSLIGTCFTGIEHLSKEQMPYLDLLMEWVGQTEYIKTQNKLVSKRAAEITSVFAEGGLRSVVLKGQGTGLLYPYPNLRNPGDIDIWVDASREELISFLKKKGYEVGDVFVHHIDVRIFDDVIVEVHYNPSYTYSPFRTLKYKKWFMGQSEIQFQLFDQNVGYGYPSIEFNLVYSLLHIFRHVFHEGIGLRQLMDYYYILMHSDSDSRCRAMKTLVWMGLERFTSSIMYVEQSVFELGDEYLLCCPDSESGQFILNGIIQNGNFGQYNKNTLEAHKKGYLNLYLHNVSRLLGMLRYYPSEVLWSPLWKPAHYMWRKIKGF